MVLSQSLFQRQHKLHVSNSFPGDICLILETSFASAIQCLETLEPSYYLFSHPPTCLSPLPVPVVGSTHMYTPSLSRKLLFAKSEWNSDFQRVSLVSRSNSHLMKKDASVHAGAAREGLWCPFRSFWAPRKTNNWLCSPQPHPASVAFLPFLSPLWVAPQTSFYSSLPTSGET